MIAGGFFTPQNAAQFCGDPESLRSMFRSEYCGMAGSLDLKRQDVAYTMERWFWFGDSKAERCTATS